MALKGLIKRAATSRPLFYITVLHNVEKKKKPKAKSPHHDLKWTWEKTIQIPMNVSAIGGKSGAITD